MSWMRRAGAVVLAIALVVLIPVPAEAVGWKPPVDPYPDLPSAQFQGSWVQTSSGPFQLKNYEPGSAGWAETQAEVRAKLAAKGYPPPAAASKAKTLAVKTGKVPNITSLPKTLTAPTVIARGNAATAGFMVGWGIVDGTLAAYTATTGTNPLQGICSDPPWVQGIVGTLYMFSAPDCGVPVANPNEGAVGGPVVDLGAYGAFRPSTNPKYATLWCGGTSPQSPGEGLSYKAYDAEGRLATPGTWSGSGWEAPLACGGTAADTRWMARNFATIRVVRTSNGSVVKSAGVTQAATNPTRSMRCSIQWPDGSWSASDTVAYKEPDGVPLASLNDTCATAWTRRPSSVPAGTNPKTIKVDSTDDLGKTTEIQNQSVPEQTPEEKAAQADNTGKGLVLWKGTESCLTWSASCAGWWAETDNGASTTTDYRCTYGDVSVSLAQCYVYKDTFEPSSGDATITDPATGEVVQWSSQSNGANSTDPQYGPSPADECWDEWSSVPNPVEWVFHPVQCALVWGFAPRQAKLDEFQHRVDESWRGSTPGKFAASIASVGVAFDALGPGNCRGVILPVPKVQKGSFLPAVEDRPVLQACPGDFFEPFAPVFFWLITISIGVGGFFIIKRQIDRLVNN